MIASIRENPYRAAPTLTRALELFLDLKSGTDEVGRSLWLARSITSGIVAVEVWDAESWHALAAHWVQLARDTGALLQLQFALVLLAWTHLLAGELATVALLVEEDRLIAEATGNSPLAYAAITLSAWRGREREASELIEATVQEATSQGLGHLRDLRELGALQRPRSPRCRARRCSASIRERSAGVRAFRHT